MIDREILRSRVPPILVTNATMLKYRLVRTQNAPIQAQSRGKLEWVVLDEAHTYVGSQAAEAALLIRRVLLAIGGIRQVAMNNVPPHPANYLQRAGRAGRRQEARSLAMTLCKPNPLDQAVFGDTRWAFRAVLPAPRVALNSPTILQRHIHSFLLSRFLSKALSGSGQQGSKLTCGMFFLEEPSLAMQFERWCREESTSKDTGVHNGLRRLLRHSVFERKARTSLLENAADRMAELREKWRIEWDRLKQEETELAKEADVSPALRAVRLRLQRLEGEYLLRELATRNFLPGYGFPTDIASFDNLTVHRFKQIKKQQETDPEMGREDNRYRRRELANRDLATALSPTSWFLPSKLLNFEG